MIAPLLSDSDLEVRKEVVRAIVSIGTQHSLDPLVTATRDNDPEVQIAAADGLVNFYVPGYLQTGISKFSSAIRSRFDRENKDIVEPWVTVRPEVIEALGKLARGPQRTGKIGGPFFTFLQLVAAGDPPLDLAD